MLKRKRKEIAIPVPEEPARLAVPAPPPLPEVERSFFDLLLSELYGGLRETEKLAKKPNQTAALLRKCAQTRSTVSYAMALLRLEALKRGQPGEPTELTALLNGVLNGLRREFLYAGVTVRRPEDALLQGLTVPDEAGTFLLEEMIGCCLRCAPEGKNLYINAKRIGPSLLLSLRSEGPARHLAPLLPLMQEGGSEEDYGFAMCAAGAALLGWTLRWEADEAGVRMFADIPLTHCAHV